MSALTTKRKRTSSASWKKRSRPAAPDSARYTTYFDTLPIDVVALIAGFVVRQTCKTNECGARMGDYALQLLEAGGTLGDGAALEFGYWTDARKRVDVHDGLWLYSRGKGYKTTRRLAQLMGARLHTLALVDSGVTKAYANILRVHAKGLRNLYVHGRYRPRGWCEKLEALLEAVGELDFFFIEWDCGCGEELEKVLKKFVGRFKGIRICIHSCSECWNSPAGLYEAIVEQGSLVRCVNFDLCGDCVVVEELEELLMMDFSEVKDWGNQVAFYLNGVKV